MAIIQGLGGPNRSAERPWGMDSWLIFQPFNSFLWEDGDLYSTRIIGFTFLL